MSVWISDEKLLIFASLISPSKMILFEKKYQTFDTVFHHQMKHCVSCLIYYIMNGVSFSTAFPLGPWHHTHIHYIRWTPITALSPVTEGESLSKSSRGEHLKLFKLTKGEAILENNPDLFRSLPCFRCEQNTRTICRTIFTEISVQMVDALFLKNLARSRGSL